MVYLLGKKKIMIKSAKLHIGYLVEAFWTLSSSWGCKGTLVMQVAWLPFGFCV